jgi:hypothetical protein
MYAQMAGARSVTAMLGSPAVTVVFELERRPRVVWDCVGSDEQARLEDWISSHDDYVRLIAAAYELAEQERAA